MESTQEKLMLSLVLLESAPKWHQDQPVIQLDARHKLLPLSVGKMLYQVELEEDQLKTVQSLIVLLIASD